MKRLFITLIGALVLCSTYPLMAQDRWRFDLRGDVAAATQDLGDADLCPGIGFEANLAYRFMPHLSGYVGWGWHGFSADQSFAGTDTDFDETGYKFGLQFTHPLGDSPVSYLARLGGIVGHIETENDEGDITGDSDQKLGWEIGGGLVIPLGSGWDLMPLVGYRSLSQDIEIGEVVTDVDLSYVSFGASISRTF
jgi:outer membrane protein with beta-barrel domain